MSKNPNLLSMFKQIGEYASADGVDGVGLACSSARSSLCLFIRAAYSKMAMETGMYALDEIAVAMNKSRPVVKPSAAMVDGSRVCGEGFTPKLVGRTWDKAYRHIKRVVMPKGEFDGLLYAPGVAVSFDPSSTCTGYAVFKYGNPVEFGRVIPSDKPKRKSLTDMALANGEPNIRRIADLASEVDSILREFRPQFAVVEVSTARAGTGSKKGAGSSLITYGTAVGVVLGACLAGNCETIPVNERSWTRGLGRKSARKAYFESLYPGKYKASMDKGGDIADAGLLYLYAHKSYELDSFLAGD